MRYALTADQMRAVEHEAIAGGVASLSTLMERAGEAVAREVAARAAQGPTVVLCGPGNNGGDGWVAAHLLHSSRHTVRVLTFADSGALAGEAAAAARSAVAAGVPVERPVSAEQVRSALEGASCAVDALFGFGFRGTLPEGVAEVPDLLEESGALVISVDVPSGIDADSGATTGSAIRADVTVTFGALKRGLLIQPGALHAGDIVVADIGLSASSSDAPGVLGVPEDADMAALLPPVLPTDHKGSRGRVAVVAGSRAYSGAAVLAVQGALRLGAGYVIAVVPECIADVVRVSAPGAIVRGVPATADGAVARVDAVLTAVSDADAAVIGPGLTTAPSVREVVGALLRDVATPLVLDADALNVLGCDLALLEGAGAPLVLTPHPGEAARLLAVTAEEVQSDRVGSAVALAGARRTCLLKGPGTIIAGGGCQWLVPTGNGGLARAGSGDVLSGMIGTLLAQGLEPFEAAVLAAYLHGRAAELGTAALTPTCFIASDIPGFMPDAVRSLGCG